MNTNDSMILRNLEELTAINGILHDKVFNQTLVQATNNKV